VLGKVKVLPKWLFSVVTGSGRRQGFFFCGSDPGSGFGFFSDLVYFFFGSFSRIFFQRSCKKGSGDCTF
jgi:hypothetical protein